MRRFGYVAVAQLSVLLVLTPFVLSQSRGTFTGAVNYPAGPPVVPTNTGFLLGGVEPVEAKLGDVNGDGKPDVIVAAGCSSSTFSSQCANGSAVAVYLSNGDGTFQPPIISGGATLPGTVRSIAVGDFNNDGKLDVAVASDCDSATDCSRGSISILLGVGDGTFVQASLYVFDSIVSQAGTLVTGDFNNDGKLDLVVGQACFNLSVSGCATGAVSIYLGNGDGTLGPPTSYTAVGNSAVYPVVGDFNGDGKLDIVAGSPTAPGDTAHSSLTVLLGNGNGTFSESIATLAFGGLSALGVTDFNTDQKLDLAIIASSGTSLLVLFGNGDGTFQAPVATPTSLAAPVTNGNTIIPADLDGDGKSDLIVSGGLRTSQVNGVQIFLNDGTGNFTATRSYPMGGWLFAPIVAADFNGDGKTDVVMASGFSESSGHQSDGSINVLLGNGDGTFQGPTLLTSSGGGAGVFSAGAADFNGDGIPDLFVSNACVPGSFPRQCGASIFLGNPNATYQPPTMVVSGAGGPEFSLSADVNRDGKADLVILNSCDSVTTCSSPSVSILLGNGDGTFQSAVTYVIPGSAPMGIVTGDFNGDGILDLAAATQCDSINCSNGTVSILLGNGDGTFVSPHSPTSIGTGIIGFSLVAGDFDGDGKSDIVVGGRAATSTTVGVILLSNGDGTFRAGGNYSSGGGLSSSSSSLVPVTGDINHDGKTDIIFANNCESNLDANCANGSFGVLLGNGDGTFQPARETVVTDENLISANLTDVDGDGNLDLIASTTGGVMVARGKGDGTFQPPVIYGGLAESGGQKVLVVADLNNDGAPDIVQPDAIGNLAIFYNRAGSSTVATTSASIVAPTITYGITASVTVSVTAAQGTVTGNVSLTVDNGTSLTQALSNGSTVFNINGLSAGSHSLGASYGAQGSFAASSAVGTLQVNQAQPTVTFTGAPATASYHSMFTVAATTNASTTATISASGPCSVSGNTVTMSSGTGTCNLMAAWPADNNYLAASASQSTNATKAASTVAIIGNTPNPSVTGQAVTVTYVATAFAGTPTGNVTVTDGTGDACTASVTAGKCTLIPTTAGTKTLTATYTGDSNFSLNTSVGITQVVNNASTTTTVLSQAPNPSVPGQPVLIKFQLATIAPGSGTPSGNVIVTDGLGDSCTGTVALGSCLLSFATAGPKTVAANYAGDANFNPSMSTGVTHSVIDFLMSASPTSQSVKAGQKATYTITLTPLNGFTGQISLGCTNLPQNSTCSFSSNPIVITGSKNMSTKVTIQTFKTTAPNAYSLVFSGTFGNGVPQAGGILHYAGSYPNLIILTVN